MDGSFALVLRIAQSGDSNGSQALVARVSLGNSALCHSPMVGAACSAGLSYAPSLLSDLRLRLRNGRAGFPCAPLGSLVDRRSRSWAIPVAASGSARNPRASPRIECDPPPGPTAAVAGVPIGCACGWRQVDPSNARAQACSSESAARALRTAEPGTVFGTAHGLSPISAQGRSDQAPNSWSRFGAGSTLSITHRM